MFLKFPNSDGIGPVKPHLVMEKLSEDAQDGNKGVGWMCEILLTCLPSLARMTQNYGELTK